MLVYLPQEFFHKTIARGVEAVWYQLIVSWPIRYICGIEATDCESCVFDVFDFGRLGCFQRRNLPLSEWFNLSRQKSIELSQTVN